MTQVTSRERTALQDRLYGRIPSVATAYRILFGVLLAIAAGVLFVGVVSVLSGAIAPAGATPVDGEVTATDDEHLDQTGASIRGSPDLDAMIPDDRLSPGETTQLEVQIANDGTLSSGSIEHREAVTTARNVRVDIDDENVPFSVRTDEQAIGSVSENAPGTASFEVYVPEDIDPGEYEFRVELRYSHTSQYVPSSGIVSERTRSTSSFVTVEVTEAPQFELENASTTARVGGDGDVAVTVRNVGDEVAHDASVAIAGSETLRITDGARIVESIEPGEARTLTYDAAVDADGGPSPQELQVTVDYETDDAAIRTEESLRASVTPAPEQSFDVGDVESTLRVGSDGQVVATLENEGPADAESVVVRVRNGDELGLSGEEYAVGDLADGEAAAIDFETTVGESVDPGPRLLTLEVTYRDGDDRRTIERDVTAGVAPATDEFDVEVLDGTVTAGERAVLEVAVTNELDDTVTDVSAKLFADDPLSVSDDEAFVAELEPGETAVVTFEYRAGGNALEKTYAAAVDFQYDDDRGETRMTDTYNLPIVVEGADEDGGVPASILLVGGLAVMGIGAAVTRRWLA